MSDPGPPPHYTNPRPLPRCTCCNHENLRRAPDAKPTDRNHGPLAVKAAPDHLGWLSTSTYCLELTIEKRGRLWGLSSDVSNRIFLRSMSVITGLDRDGLAHILA